MALLSIKSLTYKDIQAFSAKEIADYFGIEQGTFAQAYKRKVRDADISGSYNIKDPLSKAALQRLSWHFSRTSATAKAISEELGLNALDQDKSLRIVVANDLQIQHTNIQTDKDNDHRQKTHTDIQTYKDKIHELNTDIQTYKDKYNDLQIQIQKYKQTDTDKDNRIHTYIHTQKELTDKIQELKDKDNYKNLLSVNSELSKSKVECDSLDQKLQSANQEIALWKSQLTQLRGEINDLLKTTYEKETEIQHLNFKVQQKDFEKDREIRETEKIIRLQVGDEIKKAKEEWDANSHTYIHTYIHTISNLEAENAQLKAEIKQIAKSNTEGYLKIEMYVLASITGLSLIGFMVFQGIKTRDFFMLTDAVGKAAGETSATIFAMCFAFFGLALTIALPMADKKMAEKVWFDFLPVRTVPLLVFSIICFAMNIYVNSNNTDEFTSYATWGIIHFKSFLTPFAEFCFGFILLTLRNKREDFIKLIDLLK